MEIFKDNKFILALTAFIVFNILLYIFIFKFHDLVPFNRVNYVYNAHHFFEDPRIRGEKFNLLDGLSQFDAQWYLKISKDGYPKNPQDNSAEGNKGSWERLIYAFPPLFPLVISAVNALFRNIEFSAFILTNILLVANFISLYYVVTKLFSAKLALKTSFLLFLFPFSIFYRSFFTEGLFLFLFIWFSYFFLQKKYLLSGLLIGLLAVTRLTVIPLVFLLIYYQYLDIKLHKYSLIKFIFSISLAAIPLGLWILFNRFQTSDSFFFKNVLSNWFSGQLFGTMLIKNIITVFSFAELPFHGFHASKIDTVMTVFSAVFLIKSYQFLPRKLWWASLILLIVPLITKDTMSYSRYAIVVFPLFITLSSILNKTAYLVLCGIFLLTLLTTSLYFVNWWWVG
ncbi:glycosyltransferase family 39 protein [Candidatus Daviesbacteria bacterium]|nr:glycosyltransferase family 39 protein [Candidatus Daviesbacteria bacterium]